MFKAVKYRIYPDDKQAQFIIRNCGCCRFVYNMALRWRQAAYNADGTSLTYSDLAYGLTRSKAVYPWLKEADSASLQQSLLHQDDAFKSFFNGTAGYPKFKKRHGSRLSYTTPMNNNSIRITSRGIRLPKSGTIKARIHRQIPDTAKLLSATVSMDPDGRFYCSIAYEYDDTVSMVEHPEFNAVGLDYKSDGLYVDSNGYCPHPAKNYRDSERHLGKAQQSLSRKQRGSNNYRKQQKRVARIHAKIANRRKDFLHKESASIAKKYDLVAVEDLNMRAMSNHGFGNGKATLDNGYGMFLNMLAYKLAGRGKELIRVDKWFPSSQICSCCGHQDHAVKNLAVRSWTCPNCGTSHDRDINAAVNIRNEGIRIYLNR